MTITCVKEIDVFKAKIKEIEKLIIKTIDYECNKLIRDLDFKEKLIVKKVKEIEENKSTKKNS